MNTSTAALQANVTVATIRTWCRRGVITATKAAGRWIIDTASLARRITIGLRRARMATPTYRIEEHTIIKYGQERTAYTIVRTDGTPSGYGTSHDTRITNATYLNRQHAEINREFLERTPAGYRLERGIRNAAGQPYWTVSGATPGDPQPLRYERYDEDAAATWLNNAIARVNRHAEAAPDRIAKHAKQQEIEAAQAAAHSAREARLAELRRTRGQLATPSQVDYILLLLAQRKRSGEGGGFFIGPTDRTAIEELSRADASSYITSLKGNY